MTTTQEKRRGVVLGVLRFAGNVLKGKPQQLISTYSERGKKLNEMMTWYPVSHREMTESAKSPDHLLLTH